MTILVRQAYIRVVISSFLPNHTIHIIKAQYVARNSGTITLLKAFLSPSLVLSLT